MTRLRELPPQSLGLITTLLGLALTVVAFSGVWRKPFEHTSATVVADFERAPQLRKGDQVRIDGHIIGKVGSLKPSSRGDEARATLKLDRDAGPLYADARARLRIKTLLGGAFYVALDRGTPSAGPLGTAIIPSRRTSVQVEVEDVTDVFRGPAVSGFRKLPGVVADALRDPAPPSTAIATAAQIAAQARRGLAAARGTDPGEDLPDVVSATADTVDALNTDAPELQQLVSGAAQTLDVTHQRSRELRQAIASGPGVTHDLTFTLARLDGTLDTANVLVRRLRRSAPAVAPTLRTLRPALQSTTALLKTGDPTLRRLVDAQDSLGVLTPRANALIDSVRPTLVRLDDKILPYLGRKDPVTGYSTSVMIGGTAAGFGGAAGQQDGNGHFIRFPASVGASSVYLPCKTSLLDANSPSLLACDKLDDAVGTYLKYLPSLTPTPGGGK